MNKTEYKVRHIRCNMHDFNADLHRFRFEYGDKEYVAYCYGSVDVQFDSDAADLPDEVLDSVTKTIYKKMDTEEKSWRYPEEAYAIANAYCEENF